MSVITSAARVVSEAVVGLLLAGLVAGVVVPARPGAMGPEGALGLTLVCVGLVVWVDWQFVRKH